MFHKWSNARAGGLPLPSSGEGTRAANAAGRRLTTGTTRTGRGTSYAGEASEAGVAGGNTLHPLLIPPEASALWSRPFMAYGRPMGWWLCFGVYLPFPTTEEPWEGERANRPLLFPAFPAAWRSSTRAESLGIFTGTTRTGCRAWDYASRRSSHGSRRCRLFGREAHQCKAPGGGGVFRPMRWRWNALLISAEKARSQRDQSAGAPLETPGNGIGLSVFYGART